MFCPNCGKEIGTANFCPDCGAPIMQVAYEEGHSKDNVIVKEKKPLTKRWWFWVLIVFAFLVLVPRTTGSNSEKNVAEDTISTPKSTPYSNKKEISYEVSNVVERIDDSSLVVGESGKRFSVIIEITNTGDVPIYLEKCSLDYEDDAGHLLQTEDYISNVPDVVQPGEKGYFYTNGSISFNEDVSFDNGCNLVPVLSIEKAKGELKRHTVEDTSLYRSYQVVGCKGRIVNETDKDISYMYVTTVFYDHNGNVLGISGTSVTDIKANSKKSFDDSGIFLRGFSPEDIGSYWVYADETYMQF